MTYGMFWGCVIPRRLPHIEASIRLILTDLDIDYVDIDGALCCPDPLVGETLSPLRTLTLSTFNLIQAQQENVDTIISPCNGCYYSLNKAAKRLEEKDLRFKINQALVPMGIEYKRGINVVRLIDILLNNIKGIQEKTIKPLKGLKIASHHGCKMFAEERMRNLKDMRNPILIDKVIESLGATPVSYPHKNTCCGGTLRGYPKELLLDIVQEKLLSAKNFGADCITTMCPLCYLYLENQQLLIRRERNIDFNIPILALSELIALAFGHTYQSSGLGYHIIPFKSKTLSDIIVQ